MFEGSKSLLNWPTLLEILTINISLNTHDRACRYILSKELKDLFNLNTNFPHSKLFPRHVCEGQWSLLPGARERDTWRPLLPALVHGHAPQPHLPAPRVPGGEHCDVNIWNINLLVTFRCGTPPTFVGTEAGSRAVPGATPWTPSLGGSTATLSHAVRTSCFEWQFKHIDFYNHLDFGIYVNLFIFSGKCDWRKELQRGGGGDRGENHHHRGNRIFVTCPVSCMFNDSTNIVEYLLFVALIILSRIICNCGGCKFVTKCPILWNSIFETFKNSHLSTNASQRVQSLCSMQYVTLL